jgi:ribosome-associated protein
MIAKQFRDAAATPARLYVSCNPVRRHDPTPEPAELVAPSKTRRKKDMIALQDLGEALVALDPGKLAGLDLPERLSDAIALARTLTKHEARRRQMQYIGRLMREVDPEPIRATLAGFERLSHAERAHFAAAERWRDRLLGESDAIAAFVTEHPDVDGAALAELVREARAERASGRPPHSFRALFRLVSREVGGK